MSVIDSYQENLHAPANHADAKFYGAEALRVYGVKPDEHASFELFRRWVDSKEGSQLSFARYLMEFELPAEPRAEPTLGEIHLLVGHVEVDDDTLDTHDVRVAA